MAMHPNKIVTVVSPAGIVCKFAANAVATGPFASFTAVFEIPPTVFGKNTDYQQVMKDALGIALQKYIEQERAEARKTK